MKRIHLAAMFTLAALAAAPAPALAGYTYDVSLSFANVTGYGGSAGTDTVTGTVTLASLGANLAASDVVGYSLTFSTPDDGSLMLTPSNGQVDLGGDVVLSAMASAITVTLPPNTDGIDGVFGFDSSGSNFPSFSIGYSTDFASINTLLFGVQLKPSGILDEGGQDLGAAGGTYVFATASAAVPEPSSLTLCGIAVALGATARLRLRRRDVA